ncbi:hypothetical protein IF655_10920 [Streptomyces sp. DSM 110735]|nr:hypothetical protein [Streptomyces sp. DSM 110735]
MLTAARERSERAAELVSPFIATTPEWQRRLETLIEWSLAPGLIDLAIGLVDSGQLDQLRGPIAVNSDFWSVLYGLVETDPVGSARLVGAYLRRGATLAAADGSGDPFLSQHLPVHSQTADKVLSGIAIAQPHAYVEAVLSFVIEVARASSTKRQTPTGHWAYRSVGGHGVDQSLFNNLDHSLRALPAIAPEATDAALRNLTPWSAEEPEELRFLVCRMYAVLGRPDEAIDWLLSNERNLRLGWSGSPRWATRELIESASPHCGEATLNRLIAVLLDHQPPWELPRKDRPSWWGRSQYELLSVIPKFRQSHAARRRLAQWERRFPDQPPAPPAAVSVSFVGSPITPEAARHMTDEHWRRAFTKYARPDHRPAFGRGGPLELAEVLRGCAETEPDRFCDLALTLNSAASTVYLNAIITSVAPHVTTDRWTALVAHADRVAGTQIAHAVCNTLQSTPGLFTPGLATILSRYAADSDPDHDPTETGSEVGDLLTAGMNSKRGRAAITLAALFRHQDQHRQFLIEHTGRLADDRLLAVRVCAAQAVSSLIDHAPDNGLDTADRLFSHPSADVHNATTSQRLLINALSHAPDRFAPHLKRALRSQGTAAELAGQTWAVALLNGWPLAGLPSNPQDLSVEARRGAAAVFAQRPGNSLFLTELLNDLDEETRANSSHALRDVFDLPPGQADKLIQAFMDSTAFSTNSEHLSFALHQHTGILPTIAIDVCERVLRIGGNEIGDIRTRRAAEGYYLVSIVLKLYRQSPPQLRKRCLDLIDALSLASAHGLLGALDSER